MRGVNLARAPEELRCAIDGKLLGVPLRSPQGCLFERATLEAWLDRCGSVCPVTGEALRLDDCVPDQDAEFRVLDWVRMERAEHKRRAKERQSRKALRASQPEADSSEALT